MPSCRGSPSGWWRAGPGRPRPDPGRSATRRGGRSGDLGLDPDRQGLKSRGSGYPVTPGAARSGPSAPPEEPRVPPPDVLTAVNPTAVNPTAVTPTAVTPTAVAINRRRGSSRPCEVRCTGREGARLGGGRPGGPAQAQGPGDGPPRARRPLPPPATASRRPRQPRRRTGRSPSAAAGRRTRRAVPPAPPSGPVTRPRYPPRSRPRAGGRSPAGRSRSRRPTTSGSSPAASPTRLSSPSSRH